MNQETTATNNEGHIYKREHIILKRQNPNKCLQQECRKIMVHMYIENCSRRTTKGTIRAMKHIRQKRELFWVHDAIRIQIKQHGGQSNVFLTLNIYCGKNKK